MHIHMNGKDYALGQNVKTIRDLLEEYKIDPLRIAVEKNGEILGRKEWNEAYLEEGDQIEIVHFVGGG
ncbi:sulfur carrier protein ThiS [Alkalicoccus halolimnae]|uniref:Sulfur carrier protein ThiS n=1 Tax=Alkalicoccus halolimnae TaxID=1667239 RepID=A0A5C7FCK8_9BACI|nr:sulfur carrier protein ThiS [Alkalicoccus halolimnae]TXF85077.1 sulfur carrier protein ThiS [Alkalicoccus halolimnae]